MNRIAKNVLGATLPGLVVLLVLLEVVFRYVIVAPDPPRQYMDLANNVIRFDTGGKRDGVFTAGRLGQQKARWHVNNYGWVSDVDYRAKAERSKPLIAVIGDSYVEALQVDADKSFVALLRRSLADSADVYGFGLAGAPLSEYLRMIRYVDRVFDPDVIVVNLVHNDFDESLREIRYQPIFLQVSVRDSAVVEVPPVPLHSSELKHVLSNSAMVRYVFYRAPNVVRKLQRGPEHKERYNENVAVERMNANRAAIERATAFLLAKIVVENSGRKVYFIMGAPRGDIYGGTLDSSPIVWVNDMVARAVRQLSCVLIDQTDYFKRDYEANRRRFETRYDNHWNEYGHEVTFRQLSEALRARKR